MKHVSVVVPVYNGERTLRTCLESLLASEHPSFEVVLVDDGSTDGSLAIARAIAADDDRLEVLSISHGGPARARNHGIRAGTGAYVAFTDADTVAPRGWLTALCRELDARKVAAVGGGISPLKVSNAYEAAEDFRYRRLVGSEARSIGALPTCNLMVRREILEQVGGFDEGFVCAASEDFDLCFRIKDLGHTIWFAPECTILHDHPQHLRPIVRRGFIQGREGARLAFKRRGNVNHWRMAPFLHCLENAAVLSFWLLEHLPHVPSRVRWIIAAFDIAFAVGWLSFREQES